MSSRLASLLVQEGLVDPKRMADAFKRQVIYGGTLETVLLELDAIDETVLLDALGRSSGLPIAGDLPSAEHLKATGVASWFPVALSERFRALPVVVDGNVLRVLVTDPPDRKQLDELGYLLSRSIDPIVVPEHRFVHAASLVYGTPVTARFASLQARLMRKESERGRRTPAAPTPDPFLAPHPGVPAASVPSPEVTSAKTASMSESAGDEVAGPPSRQTQELRAVSPEPMAAASDIKGSNALSVDEAKRQIELAGDREQIFEALCRGARSLLDFVALLTVQGDLATGRMALGDRWSGRDALSSVTISLDRPSPFRSAAQGRAPYIGKIGEEPVGMEALSAFGRRGPMAALLVPVVLRERSVALVYGDSTGRPIDGKQLSELAELVAATSRGFQRLILQAKGDRHGSGGARQGGKPTSSTDALGQPADQAPGHPLNVRGAAAISSGHAESKELRESKGAATESVDALVLSVIRGDERAAQSAGALLSLGDVGAEAIIGRIPGPVRIDRQALRGPIPKLSQHGPLLALLARFGAHAVPPLLRRATDSAAEVRFYVVLALGEIAGAEAVGILGLRLFDEDAGVRKVAIEALRDQRPSDALRELVESLRGELPGPDPARQCMAADALGGLCDAPSIPRLIELVKHPDEALVQAARRALVAISKQDYGTSRWRWRTWWEKHHEEPRIEWLLEGLGHPEASVRQSAFEELRRIAPESFGYQVDQPRPEREDARRRFVDWWRSRGQHAERQS